VDKKQIAIVATLDTKGDLVKYLAQEMRERDCGVITIDGGIQGKPVSTPDVSRENVVPCLINSVRDFGNLTFGNGGCSQATLAKGSV
jgi:uncharacterized protein (UPF0261 family)